MNLSYLNNTRDYVKHNTYLNELNDKIYQSESSLSSRIAKLKNDIDIAKQQREWLDVCDSFCNVIFEKCDSLNIQQLYEQHDDWNWNCKHTIYICPSENVINLSSTGLIKQPTGEYSALFNLNADSPVYKYLVDQFSIICLMLSKKYPKHSCALNIQMCKSSVDSKNPKVTIYIN